MQSVDVRKKLVDALRLDLVGPGELLGKNLSTVGDLSEKLSQRPSTWYLTGFLVPKDAAPEQRVDEQSVEELDEISDHEGGEDGGTPEPAVARVQYLPSSMGLSLLVPERVSTLAVTVRWGDYSPEAKDETSSEYIWTRKQCAVQVDLRLPNQSAPLTETEVPTSKGLSLYTSARPVVSSNSIEGFPAGARCVSVFLVNHRHPLSDDLRDGAFVFQCQLEITAEESFLPRPDLHDLDSKDPDQRIADLQYRDDCEFAVGHGVAIESVQVGKSCSTVRTTWIPQAEVERVAPVPLSNVELSMDALSTLKDSSQVEAALGQLPASYRVWIEEQRVSSAALPSQRRKETAEELLNRADVAANRIQEGIRLLDDPVIFETFKLCNKVMATAARQRQAVFKDKDPSSVKPKWHPFQLAFLLMNLPGIADPTHHEREVVDLLFFPTGGGKTEAYLGLSAFTLILRRRRNPGITSAGLSVLMRYTLRLLTLDQLSRAATLICALELERQKDVETLGDWPFEIGLWVGKAATPNIMGQKGDGKSDTARAKTIAYKNNDRKASPIPLEECPWCGVKFKNSSFSLVPNPDTPADLRITCVNRKCEFIRDNPLPILAVDEPIYRRLPCFIIATVDKFAAMPWTGDVGQFFGRVSRYDKHGFYGSCHPSNGNKMPVERLLPPDLIIQDELHLISGPLGTIVGLYESALDELCAVEIEGKRVRPKIVASTATVRRAESQIRALFNRRFVDIFPPPGPDRRDSYFAETHRTDRSNARLYVGLAAQGRSPKVVMLRSYLALLAAAEKIYKDPSLKSAGQNPADPYMTLLGYFNSLRELGGARRVIEDEVGNRLAGYSSRKRVNETEGLFSNRSIAYDVVELTSRVSTDKVSDAKRRLSTNFHEKDHVDVAIATNMISVGLDITRLGLMVVYGQPFTTAEYIQSTSRVGRDSERPGLVVTILNVHKPRDRSYYERFTAYHETFYRSVEVTSVTPFSPRAMDRGLAGTFVGLARHVESPMTPPLGAGQVLTMRAVLEQVAVTSIADRAESHADMAPEDASRVKQRVRERCLELLDDWSRIAMQLQRNGVNLQYQIETGGAQRLLYEFLDPDLKRLPPRHKNFRANRSMRDVEPSVDILLKTLDGVDLEEVSE